MTTRELVWNAMFAALRALKARSEIATRPLLKSKINARVLMQCHEAATRVVRHA